MQEDLDLGLVRPPSSPFKLPWLSLISFRDVHHGKWGGIPLQGDHSQPKETVAKKLFIPTLIFFISPFMCTWTANSILQGTTEICFIAERDRVWESGYIQEKEPEQS